MAQKLAPGSRLGEQQLAMVFECSRTIVREALTRLAARGIVTVSARRGWFVIEPSEAEAREAFEARHVIERGLIRSAGRIEKPALKLLKAHLQREKAAVKASDVGARSFLLGDFHVCLAECPRQLASRRHVARLHGAHHADRDAVPVLARRRPVLRGPRAHRGPPSNAATPPKPKR